MHFLTYTPQRERFIVLLWALLFAKCFIVEHYVQAHDVPVNSWLYVWALSISMAAVATGVFWRLRTAEHLPRQVPRALFMGWAICLVLAAFFVVGAWLTPFIHAGALMTGLSLLLCCGYAWQGLHSKALLDWFSAVGWFFMAGFLLTLASNFAFFAFGFGLLGLIVLPLACKLVVEWYQAKLALRALYIANDI